MQDRRIRGVHGPLIRLFQYNEGFERFHKCVGTTTGNRLFHVVVENGDVGTALIDLLKHEKEIFKYHQSRSSLLYACQSFLIHLSNWELNALVCCTKKQSESRWPNLCLSCIGEFVSIKHVFARQVVLYSFRSRSEVEWEIECRGCRSLSAQAKRAPSGFLSCSAWGWEYVNEAKKVELPV